MPSQSLPRPAVAFTTVLLLALGCDAPLSSSHPRSTATTAPFAVQSSGSYAAMEEVLVTGGELRLEVELELVLDDGAKARVIAFPLVHTDVEVEVAGMLALYTVEQQFDNPFDDALEAVYLFPLGDEAAVTDYQIVIGDRTIEGEIKTREEARKTYQEAKSRGHTAALLEQEKANVFSQHIANIAPRESIKVRFRYTEMLDYADNRYELAFPMVVGPRYLPGERGGRRPVGAHRVGETPRTTASVPYVDAERTGHTISVRARIDAGVPLVSVASPTHEVDMERTGDTSMTIRLAEREAVANRDLVLRYQTASKSTMVGVMTHRIGDDGFFTLIVQPKADYRTGDIAGREVVILIDRSGSMNGVPLGQAKQLAIAIITTLSPRDVFNVIGFASGTTRMGEQPITADAAGKAAGIEWVKTIESGGGTELEDGLLRSLATPPSNDRVRMVYVLSDGFVGNDDVILGAAQRHLGQNRIYPVGIGAAPNRYLFDRLARTGRGFVSYLLPSDDAAELASDLVRLTAYPYLTDVEIDWGGLKVVDLVPSRLPDIHAGQPLVVSGRYRSPGAGQVKVKARAAGKAIAIPLEVILPQRADRKALSYVWARHQIRELMSIDHESISDEVRAQVTKLGLDFHMVTEFTSFVAVDRTRVVGQGGKLRTVVQPAAVPEGVNLDTAVGDEPAPHAAPTRSSSYDHSSSGGSSWGGGDSDPLTLLILLLLLPAAWTLRRFRSR